MRDAQHSFFIIVEKSIIHRLKASSHVIRHALMPCGYFNCITVDIIAFVSVAVAIAISTKALQ